MTEPSMLPAPRPDGRATRELADRVEARVLAPALEGGYQLRVMGTTVSPRPHGVANLPSGRWLFVHHLQDPTAEEYGGKIPVPATEHAKLTRLWRAGVRPDLLWLAHELPATWRDGDALPRLVPTPPELRRHDEVMLRRLRSASQVLRRAMRATGVATATAISAVSAGLDPMVLGGVQHPTMPVVQWVVLAQWNWD